MARPGTAKGDSGWVIELERGWSPWQPGDMAFADSDARAGVSISYRVGKSDFEAHFDTDTDGTQTNLSTGKVRRLKLLKPGERPPQWEGIGARRRPTNSEGIVGTKAHARAPEGSAAAQAQSQRDQRRYSAPVGVDGLSSRGASMKATAASMGKTSSSQGRPSTGGYPKTQTEPRRQSGVTSSDPADLPAYMRHTRSSVKKTLDGDFAPRDSSSGSVPSGTALRGGGQNGDVYHTPS